MQNRNLPVDDASNQYFGGGLHDGFVVSAERTKDRVVLTITDRDLDDFVKGQEEFISLVKLVFEGVNYANAARFDSHGWLKWSDWSKWKSLEDTRCSDTSWRDWFYQEGGKIQWICEIHKYESNQSRLSDDIYLFIDCEKAYAIPESPKVLRARIGDEQYETWTKINRFARGTY